MSKPAPASTPKIPTSQPPTKSAWTRGPPSSAVSSTPRSQSPSPANATQPSTPTHSRKPSALGGPSAPNATFRDGVSVPRSIQPPQRPAAGLSFGSIAEPPAPLSSSPASVPAISSDASNVKSFGTIPASNGVPAKPASVRSPSKSNAPTMPSSPSPAPGAKLKFDVKSLFMNGSGASNAPSPTVSNATEASPTQRPTAAPSSQVLPPSQPFHTQRPGPPSSNANTNTSGPRSPQYSRPVNMPGSTGRNAPPNNTGLGPSSPRLSSIQAQHPPHPPQPPMASHPVPIHHQHVQAGIPWAPAYYYPYNVDQYVGGPFPWQTNPSQSMHPPPPHTPTHAVASPARPPAAILHGGPPSVPPATPPTTNSPYPPPPPQVYPYPQSPPPPNTPQTPSSRLNTQAPSFVPKQRISSAVKIRNPENGAALDFSSVAPPPASSSEPASTSTPSVTLGHQRRSTVIRMESEETRKKRMEEQQAKEQEKVEQELVAKRQRDHEEKVRKRKEEEEERKRKEEEERKQKEEEEKLRKEEEEKKRKEEQDMKRKKEEAEKKRKEEEVQKKRAEEERRKRVEEEERKRKEDEERQKREVEERKRVQKENEERAEKERLRKEEEERERLRREEVERDRVRLEEENRRKKEEASQRESGRKVLDIIDALEALDEDAVFELNENNETGNSFENAGSPAPSLTAPSTLNKTSPSPVSSVEPVKHKRPVPGPLDLSATSKAGLPPPLPSALATARAIDDLDKIQYPEGILSPKPELNAGGSRGKFRYDRDFLLQFMALCKDKPDSMPALDAIGLEPADQTSSSRARNNSRSSMAPPPNLPSRSGLGVGGPLGAKAGSSGAGFMGQFGIGSGKLSGSEAASMGRSASLGGPAGGVAFPRAPPMVRTASQGGTTPLQPSSLNPTGRTRSQRGGKHRDTKGGAVSAQERERAISMAAPNTGASEPVEPLKASENRWMPMSALKKQAAMDSDSEEVVERKVKALLNKLSMEKFNSISDQIITWANRSEKEKDGRTLIQVIRLVFEKATDEAAWSEMYARLCRKMMEQISQNVQDDGIRAADGKPIAGGLLFRKYLLNRCQEDFERGWSMKEAAAKAAESKAVDDRAAKEAAGKDSGEAILYSEEYYAAQKAKRRGLGLVKFIGELFKLQMLTERIMHECIKKLLGNVENPEEEEIESLCKLLSTVGRQLDTDKARSHMDVYFQRMKELSKSPNITSRMQFMLLDVLDLRDRKWVARNAQAAPTTIAAVHEQAAKDQAKAQSEQSLRSLGQMSRGGSRRGEQRSSYSAQTADGWTSVSAARPPPTTAGDLTQFGKISKGPVTSFGPGSVFANKTKDPAKGRDGSMSRTSSTSNMFAMLNSEAASDPPATGKSSRPPSRKPSADFTQSGVPEPPQRKKLALLPRTKPVPGETKMEEQEHNITDEEQINSKIEEDLKEFWAVRDLDEADVYFPSIPIGFRGRFVDKLVASALERRETDARLLAQFLGRAGVKGDCPLSVLEEGFLPHVQNIEDIAIDAPAAYTYMAILLKGADLPRTKVEELAGKIIVDDDPLVHPRDRLLREYDNTDS